jgi:hypothetical protein
MMPCHRAQIIALLQEHAGEGSLLVRQKVKQNSRVALCSNTAMLHENGPHAKPAASNQDH